jgi:hypothetical protein
VFHLQTKFNRRSCTTSRVNATKLQTKQNGRTVAILSLHISQKYYPDKRCIQNLLPHIISRLSIEDCQRSYSLVSSLVRHVATSECRNLKTKGVGVSSTDWTYTSDFVKISQPDSKFEIKIKEHINTIAILKIVAHFLFYWTKEVYKTVSALLFIALTHVRGLPAAYSSFIQYKTSLTQSLIYSYRFLNVDITSSPERRFSNCE